MSRLPLVAALMLVGAADTRPAADAVDGLLAAVRDQRSGVLRVQEHVYAVRLAHKDAAAVASLGKLIRDGKEPDAAERALPLLVQFDDTAEEAKILIAVLEDRAAASRLRVLAAQSVGQFDQPPTDPLSPIVGIALPGVGGPRLEPGLRDRLEQSLVARLREPGEDPEVRAAAAASLGFFPGGNPAAFQTLYDAAAEPGNPPLLRILAVDSLAYRYQNGANGWEPAVTDPPVGLPPSPPEKKSLAPSSDEQKLLTLALKLLDEKDPRIESRAMTLLLPLGAKGRPAAARLLAIIDRDDGPSEVTAGAIQTLIAIDAKERDQVVRRLNEALAAGRRLPVRRAAAAALSQLLFEPPPVGPRRVRTPRGGRWCGAPPSTTCWPRPSIRTPPWRATPFPRSARWTATWRPRCRS